MKAISRRTVWLCLVAMLGASAPVHATWVDDWMTNKTSSGAGFFLGSNRGYLTGGTFSVRWKQNKDKAVTFSPPTISAGCGGINIFNGGVSFLNYDWIVSKLEGIIMNAASVAFNMAIEALSPTFSKALEVAEGTENFLNSLQQNECGIATSLVSNTASYAEQWMSGVKNYTGRSSVDSGSADNYTANVDSIAGDKAKAAERTQSATSECDSDWMNSILGAGGGLENGSLLKNMFAAMGYPQVYLPLARGLVGDVNIRGSDEGYSALPVPPCVQNNNVTLFALLEDAVVVNTSSTGESTCNGGGDVGLRKKMGDALLKLRDKIKGTDTDGPDAAQQALIGTVPFPAQEILTVAVAAGTDNTTLSQLTEIGSVLYAQKVFRDLSSIVHAAVARSLRLMRQGAAPSGDTSKCQDAIIVDNLLSPLRDLSENVERVTDLVNHDAETVVAQTANIEALLSQYRSLAKTLSDRVSSDFRATLSHR